MIRVFLGNLGSGKSVYAVREIVNDESDRMHYSNMVLKKVGNFVHIRPEHVIKKSMVGKKIHFDLNLEYWNQQKKPLNVLWDEVHLTASSRQSMSKVNIVLSRFLAMARRITGFDKRGYGHFTFIAQKERTVDVNIKELCNEIFYFVSHWVVRCEGCGTRLAVNSERQQVERCIRCGSWKIVKEDLNIEVFVFNNWEKFYRWEQKIKGRWYVKRYIITDIEQYFRYYDTLQTSDIWDSYVNSPADKTVQ